MKNYKKAILWGLFSAWLLTLLRITVFRDGCFSHGLCSGRVEWLPFVYLAKLIRVRYWRYFYYLFFGNILWFVPAGIFGRLFGKRFAVTLLFGFSLSAVIELLQYLLGSGVTEVEDVILNTLGAALGYPLGALFQRLGNHNR